MNLTFLLHPATIFIFILNEIILVLLLKFIIIILSLHILFFDFTCIFYRSFLKITLELLRVDIWFILLSGFLSHYDWWSLSFEILLEVFLVIIFVFFISLVLKFIFRVIILYVIFRIKILYYIILIFLIFLLIFFLLLFVYHLRIIFHAFII